MTTPSSIDPARFLHEQLAEVSPDLLRQMLSTFINTLMSAEADAVCGAPYGMPSPERVNARNGYRHRDFDTRAGTIDVATPKLRSGTYFPGLAAGAPQAGRVRADVRGGHLLPAGGVHQTDGQAGPSLGDHGPVPVAGLPDGRRPDPTPGPGPLNVRRGGRVDDEGP